MVFEILQQFKVIVYPSKLNTLVTEETIFGYDAGTTITAKDGLPFKVLRDIYNGDLVNQDEYQIFVSFPVFSLPDLDGNCELMLTPTMEVEDFATLQGMNDLMYAFVYVHDPDEN